jgi:hypothetical protein
VTAGLNGDRPISTGDPPDAVFGLSRAQEHLVAAAVFLILTALFFLPILTSGSTFSTVADTETQTYPWQAHPPSGAADTRMFPLAEGYDSRTAAADQAVLSRPWYIERRRALRQRTLALWDRSEFAGGYPLFANASSAQLYPPHLVAAAAGLSPERAHDAFSALHVFLAGLLMYLFLRQLGIGLSGALLGGVSWMFASFNMAWLHFEVIGPPLLVFLPLDLLMVRRAWLRGTLSGAVLAGLALGLTMMAGQFLFMALVCTIAGSYAVALALATAVPAWRSRERRRAFEAAAVPLASVVVALGVSAVVVIPSALNLAENYRANFSYQDLYRTDAYGLPRLGSLTALLRIFVPYTKGTTVQSINRFMSFAGTFTALFALLAVLSRRLGAWLGRAMVLGVVLIAFGGPGTWLAYHVVPLLRSFRPWSRLFPFLSFGVALLGAIGLDETIRRAARAVNDGAGTGPDQRAAVRTRVRAVAGVAVGVTAMQLVTLARDLNPEFQSTRQAYLMPRTGLIRALERYQREAPWPGRSMAVVSPPDVMMLGAAHLAFDLDMANGYDSVVPRRTYAMLQYLSGLSIDKAQRGIGEAFLVLPFAPRYELLERLGIGAIAAPPSLTIDSSAFVESTRGLEASESYRGTDGNVILIGEPTGPRLVGDATLVSDSRTALATFADPAFPWRNRVVLERTQLARVRRSTIQAIKRASREPPQGSLARVRPGINTLSLKVDSDRPAWLVVPQNWNRGWRARVNGTFMPVLRGNYTQQVVPVPAGRSTVALRYTPVGFGPGALTSAATLLVALAVGMVAVSRNRHRRS